MPLPTGTILGILGDNLRKRKSVLPLTSAQSTDWAKGLELPRGGETILYTGHMYQLIPAISAMAGQMSKLEDSWVTRFFGLGRFANKFVNLSFFMAMSASKQQREDCERMLRNTARLLEEAGISFGYLYDEEMYTGALAYDEGMDDVFRRHAETVNQVFERHGVRRIITVDPHTTNMLRDIYPQFVEGFDIEVKSYLEVLAEAGAEAHREVNEELVIHDSCVYARYENVVEPPRELLARAGVTVKEPPKECGKATFCCGGPIESLFPGKAHEISMKRVEQLKAAGNKVTTMCPICWVNLSKAAGDDIQVRDISDVLAEAYTNGH